MSALLRAVRLGQLGVLASANLALSFRQSRNFVSHENSPDPSAYLRLFPDVVVRAHQVAQQEVELLLFRHCSEIQKDQPGEEAAK